MYNAENLQEKWAPVLNHEGLNDIKDPYRKSVTAILLENQERALAEERAVLTEAPTNVGPINTPTTHLLLIVVQLQVSIQSLLV
jgi:hypothetical protein